MKDQNQMIQPNLTLESLFGKFGFSKLTEIQKKASPIILQKKDCLIIAPTGSEKTLKKIKDDEIHVTWLEVDQFSKLAEPILDHTAKYYSAPAILTKEFLILLKPD